MECVTQLDHVVINVRHNMDDAEKLCGALGFTVTPRGYHTLGSINHLMMFDTDYFELIGIPNGRETKRADLIAASVGINGLVFKADNVDNTFARLVVLGMDGDPPRAFSRPVEIDGMELDAKFRTVTVRPDVFSAGRVYFCEHGTPELVWRSEWLNHENGSSAIAEIVIVADDVKSVAADYARLVEGEVEIFGDGFYTIDTADVRLTFLRPSGYRTRYGDLASDMAGRGQIFGALVFRCHSLNAIVGFLKRMESPLPHTIDFGSIVVRLPDYNSVLEFVGPED